MNSSGFVVTQYYIENGLLSRYFWVCQTFSLLKFAQQLTTFI